MTRVPCQNCGGQVDLPPGYARAKIRCPGCGYYAEVPPDLRASGPDDFPTEPVRARPVPAKPVVVETPTPSRPGAVEAADETPYAFAEPSPTPPAPRPPAMAARVLPPSDPRDPRPQFEPVGPAGAPLLEGTQDEEDDRPYAVPGTGLKKCKHCRGELPLDATFCVHCGRELRTGAKADRTFQPIDRTWTEGWSSMLRIQVFLALQVINAVAAVMLMVGGSGMPKDLAGFATVIMTQVFQIALQAFLVGSYDTLSVKRNARGSAIITRIRRIGFFPLPPYKLPWKQSTNVGIAGTDVGWFPRLLCIYFLLDSFLYGMMGLFLSPFMLGLAFIYLAVGIGFYWVVIRPERFEVNLCDVYGSTDEVVFRCQSRAEAEDIATTIATATGLFYKPAQ